MIPKVSPKELLHDPFGPKVQDLALLAPSALTGKTQVFAYGLIAQHQAGNKPLSAKQKMWIRILLDRCLLGPAQFPPAKVDGTLVASCMGCGEPVDEEGTKGVCKKCVRHYGRDD